MHSLSATKTKMSASLNILQLLCSYSSDFFKVSSMAAKVNELLVEEPGKLELQRGVVRHLTG